MKRNFNVFSTDDIALELEGMIQATTIADFFPPPQKQKTGIEFDDIDDEKCMTLFTQMATISEREANIMDEDEDVMMFKRVDNRCGFHNDSDYLIHITVKRMCVTSTNLTIDYNASRVRDIKDLIYELGGPPIEMQRLIFRGRNLPDSLFVNQTDIINGSVLHLVQALTGGS
jgi:hypothetical protein